jgi:hypothetical protein
MVALGVMSAPSPENARVVDALTQSRARTRAGILACVERGVSAGQLPGNSCARDGYGVRQFPAGNFHPRSG